MQAYISQARVVGDLLLGLQFYTARTRSSWLVPRRAALHNFPITLVSASLTNLDLVLLVSCFRSMLACRFANQLPHDAQVIYRRNLCYSSLPESEHLPLASGLRIVLFVLDETKTVRATLADPRYLHYMSDPSLPRMLLVGTSTEQPVAQPPPTGNKRS